MVHFFPNLIFKLLSGKEFILHLTNEDVLIVNNKNKFFLFKEYFRKNKQIIKNEFNTKAFLVIYNSEIIFITFNSKIKNYDRIKFNREKHLEFNIVLIDISIEPIIEKILLFIDDHENIIEPVENINFEILKSILQNNELINSNELFMLALVQNINFSYIKFVSNNLINNETFWINATSHFIDQHNYYDLKYFKYLPTNISINFIIKILKINPTIYDYLNLELRLTKEIVIYSINNNNISITTKNIREILNIDDDVIIEFINNNDCDVSSDGIYLYCGITIPFNKIISKYEKIKKKDIKKKIKQFQSI